MERFWTLKYLQQNAITELEATVLKEMPGGDCLVRADHLPLVFSVLGAQNLPRGARLRVKLGAVDEMALDVHGTLLERLDNAEATDTEAEDEEDIAAGPIAIAVDVNEVDTENNTPSPPSVG